MAEILIKAVNAVHSDPQKDAAGCYKRGDPVVVVDNGHAWGTDELKAPRDGGKFVVIRIGDISAVDLRALVLSRWGIDIVAEERDGNERSTLRRLITLAVDLLTPQQRTTLNNTGTLGFTENEQAAISLAAVRSRIVNKRLGGSL